MPAKPVVMLDVNVVLDVLLQRDLFYENSARLIGMAELGQIKGYISADSITTLYYIVSKYRGSSQARVVITWLLQIVKIAAVDQATIDQALNLDYNDFEDAVQMVCALQLKADCLVTRNVKDFQPSLVPVLQPVEFLATV